MLNLVKLDADDTYDQNVQDFFVVMRKKHDEAKNSIKLSNFIKFIIMLSVMVMNLWIFVT